MRNWRIIAVLCGAALVLTLVAWLRGGEYDEFYSVFLITGHPRPAWPDHAFRAVTARHFYRGQAGYGEIAHALRRFDVHPPLYFWLLAAWHRLVGGGLFALRLLSVVETLAALALLARLAERLRISAPLAVTITALCYGFAYTGIVARDFALATLLVLAGALLLVDAECDDKAATGFLAGLALGAACFSNYLASLSTIALLGWFSALTWRRYHLWLSAVCGTVCFLPPGIWFLTAQAGTRAGQFPPFDLAPALFLLGRDEAGSLLGALPRYAPSGWSIFISIGLGLFLAWLVLVAIRHGFARLEPRHAGLIVAGFVAPPTGLLLLGMITDSQPIEMRYVWLGLPFAGLALAAALRERRRLLGTLLALQACAVAGLALAPATMQPAGRTMRAATAMAVPDALVIVPFGNDGVGVPGPFIAMAPPSMRLLVARQADAALRAQAFHFGEVMIARIAVDAASRALVPALDTLFRTSLCWQAMPAPRELAVFANRCRED